MSRIVIVPDGITRLNTEAVVNAANEGLHEGGGVCGVLFGAAGSAELTAACRAIGHCDTGSAVITPAFRFKSARYIIHAVGPVWRDGRHDEPRLLYNAYYAALTLAAGNGCASVGFPLISAGIFGFPLQGAWEAALGACFDFFRDNADKDLLVKFGIPEADKRSIGLKMLKAMNEAPVPKAKADTRPPLEEIRPGRYRHFKGNEYRVLYTARHSETLEPMVVYQALYGEGGIWVRPAVMWSESVTRDGKTFPRFTYIGD